MSVVLAPVGRVLLFTEITYRCPYLWLVRWTYIHITITTSIHASEGDVAFRKLLGICGLIHINIKRPKSGQVPPLCMAVSGCYFV